jgi:mycothiol system anti-sigma-R factor
VDLSEISCDEVLAQIELFIDGELDPDRAAHLADHLETCTPCQYRAVFQLKLKEVLRMKCRSEAPEHVVVRIQTMIRTERRRLQ